MQYSYRLQAVKRLQAFNSIKEEEERYNYKNIETDEEATRILQREVESRGREIQL